MIDRATLASLFGYASIACWLLAQFPQVVKNWRLQSCDGLSLPFLINWLAGDVTNLIGCVLTDQLPFQTYLATYFVFVDVTLVGQYFYYMPKTKPPPQPESMTASPRTSMILPPRRTSSYSEHHSPILPRRGGSGRGHARTAPCAPPVDSAEAMYAAALDVARAAERISRRGGSGRGRPRLHHTLPPDASSSTEHIRGSVSSSQYSEDEDDDTRTNHHRMTQSLVLPNRPPRSSSWLSTDDRGRSLTRISDIASGSHTPDTIESQLPEMRRPRRHHSRSQSVRAHGTGRRAAGVAFMGLGFIFMRATSTGGGAGSNAGGHVVPIANEAELASYPWWQPMYPAPLPSLYDASTTVVTFTNGSHPGGGHDDDEDGKPGGGPHKPEPINIRELIGRVSAWICTTMYLTSRLPQIWKNFQRKSVEGLSMLLFLMAFCGNVFYVLSILVAPVPPDEQMLYLFRALPYLLGSAGTLVFDLTIMIQSLVYGKNRPKEPHVRPPRRSRTYASFGRSRSRHPEDGGERRPLLAHHHRRSHTDPQYHSTGYHSGQTHSASHSSVVSPTSSPQKRTLGLEMTLGDERGEWPSSPTSPGRRD